MPRDGRDVFIDLTNDSDDDDGGLLASWAATKAPSRAAVASPARSRLPNRNAPNSSQLRLPASTPRNPPLPATVSRADDRVSSDIPASSIPPPRPSLPISLGSHKGKERHYSEPKKSVPGPSPHNSSKNEGSNAERAAKRMKLSAPGSDARSSISGGIPRTYAPVPTGKVVAISDSVRGSDGTPRDPQTGRFPKGDSVASSSKFPDSSLTALHKDMQRRGSQQARNDLATLSSNLYQTSSGAEYIWRYVNGMHSSTQSQPRRDPVSFRITSSPEEESLSRSSSFAGPAKIPRDKDKDSVMFDVSAKATPDFQQSTNGDLTSIRPVEKQSSTQSPAPLPPHVIEPGAEPVQAKPKAKKLGNQFSAREDQYLIFLKEVKAFTWKQITHEFNIDFPTREYSALQSRYSTYLNKRDRGDDQPDLLLPSRFASEASIDWENVHASNPGPKIQWEPTKPNPPATLNHQQDRWAPMSGGDSVSLRERSHRAKRVNYTWPRQGRGTGPIDMGEPDDGEAVFRDSLDAGMSTRSETPAEVTIAIPDTAVAVDNEPIPVDFAAEDAQIALGVEKHQFHFNENQPYLSHAQRFIIQQAGADWDWDQLSSRQWQGSIIHVDFSPKEIGIVQKNVARMRGLPRISRHSTRRRQLRDLLKDVADPKILQLISVLRKELPSRDTGSIAAFLHDAKTGKITSDPQIKRLAAARPQTSISTTQKTSTTTMLRQRELGHLSRRGWQTASRPLTYQHKNKVMDTMGPVFYWTGASSDIHVVAWAPDGETFAAGAVAVEDPHSMQYNRPNNLLYADLSSGTIHELGEHTKKREKTETGANSTHAMFASQDPKIYSTVSSVAFSFSGRVMYSTGYDGSICVWRTDIRGYQPPIFAKLNARAKIDLMAVNRHRAGVIATAANTTKSKAVRVLTIDEDDPSKFSRSNFNSSKAVSRTDLNIMPTALQFEPRFGDLLLAGFGANARGDALDAVGDLCLWEVETQTPLHITASGKNVFDIDFNPNRRHGAFFAIGCVAGSTGNRGTRSLLRVYDEQGANGYRVPIEIDCPAYDMNDLVWNPHDEQLIAAGCTDGRTYVWDLRWPVEAIRVLSHGRSLMPLPDDEPPEAHDTGVRFLSWGENSTRLYSGSSDGVIKVWDVTRSEEDTFIKDLITLNSGIMSGAFSPDRSKLVVGEVNGSVNVLEVGRDDCSIRDTEKLRYVPYDHEELVRQFTTGGRIDKSSVDVGAAEGKQLLESEQIQIVPLGGLPVRQAVQGPQYAGPYDQSVEAPFLRQQALDFQLSMTAQPGPQCDIAACKDSTVKVTCEEIGDSGRSADRIPDELRLQWKAVDSKFSIIQAKGKCDICGRPARLSTSDAGIELLCERCSFACLRCGASASVDDSTTRLECNTCASTWSIGALGYEYINNPTSAGSLNAWRVKKHKHGYQNDSPRGFDMTALDVPMLKNFKKEMYAAKWEDANTSFGDEMNALTDHYFSLAIDRPESPPL